MTIKKLDNEMEEECFTTLHTWVTFFQHIVLVWEVSMHFYLPSYPFGQVPFLDLFMIACIHHIQRGLRSAGSLLLYHSPSG